MTSWSVSFVVQGCVETGDEKHEVSNPTKAIGLGCFEGMMDIKPSFFKKDFLKDSTQMNQKETNQIPASMA